MSWLIVDEQQEPSFDCYEEEAEEKLIMSRWMTSGRGLREKPRLGEMFDCL